MKFSTTLFLLLACVCVAAGLYYDLRDKRSQHLQASNRPFNFPIESVTQLQIQNSHFDCTLERQAGLWTIAKPIHFPAAAGPLDTILQDLRDLLIKDQYDKVEEAHGIGSAKLKISWSLGSRLNYQLEFGSRHKVLALDYVLLTEGSKQRVLLIDSKIAESYKAIQLPMLRSRTLFGVDYYRAKQISITSASNAPIQLQRVGERWQLQSERSAWADSDQVKLLCEHLASCKIDAYITDDPTKQDLAEFGFQKPRYKIEFLSDGKSSAQVLLVGNELPISSSPLGRQRYVRTLGKLGVFTVHSAHFDQLAEKPADFLDRHLVDLKFNELEVMSIDLAASATREHSFIDFSLMDSKWIMAVNGKDLFPVDAEAFVALADFLSKTKAIELFPLSEEIRADLSKHGLDPEIVFRFKGKGEKNETLAICGQLQASSDEHLVLSTHWGQQYYGKFKFSNKEQVLNSARSFRSLQLHELGLDDIVGIELEVVGKKAMSYTKPGSTWNIPNSIKASVQASELDLLARTLGSLRAEAWQEPSTFAADDKYALKLRLHSQIKGSSDPVKSISYTVGGTQADGSRLWKEDSSAWVFRLESGVEESKLLQMLLKLGNPDQN